MDENKKIILTKILERGDSEFSEDFLTSGRSGSDNIFEKEEEGQLLVDVYKRGDDIIIKSIVAGVEPESLDISLNNDIITLRGKRFLGENIAEEDYYCRECYWGKFSRSIILPFKVDEDKLEAILKNGVLTVIIPKIKISQNKKIKIKEVD